MKKIILLLMLSSLLNLTLSGCRNVSQTNPQTTTRQANTSATTQQQTTTSGVIAMPSAKLRTETDFANELKKLSGATSTGTILYPDNNKIRYPFMPLLKDGKAIGYGSWVTLPIYQHYEDLITVINPDGSLQNFMPIDASEDKHPGVRKEEWRKQYFGMTYESSLTRKIDVSSGSTISSNMYIAEVKNTLMCFKKYIQPKLK